MLLVVSYKGGSDSARTAGRDSPPEESDIIVDFAVKEGNEEAALLQHEGGAIF